MDLEEYERKLRIEMQVKKDFKDKEMSEWSNAGCMAILFFVIFLIVIQCVSH